MLAPEPSRNCSKSVLVTGGLAHSGPLATAEVYDPSTGTWRAASHLSSSRFRAVATPLTTGQVLIAGGVEREGDVSRGDLYTP